MLESHVPTYIEHMIFFKYVEKKCKPLEWDILEISACFLKAKPKGHLFKGVAQCEDLS